VKGGFNNTGGISSIDVYMFPCAGTPSTTCGNVACKPATQQFQDFEAAVAAAEAASGIKVGHLWLDLEPTAIDTSDCADTCNGWNLGTEANKAMAGQFVDLATKSKYKWGIYANG